MKSDNLCWLVCYSGIRVAKEMGASYRLGPELEVT